MRKIIVVILVLFTLAVRARADTAEQNATTEAVVVFTGCWNPAVCSDPALYWNALGLNVPAIEPPASDFAPVGELALFDWANDPPAWFADTPLDPVAAPEPATWLLLTVGLLLLFVKKNLY